MITANNITDDQIKELRGDDQPLELLRLCSEALGSERPGSTRRHHARARCAEILNARAGEVKTDGLGNPLNSDAEYYVQDRRSVVGNCGSWWAPNGAGYVCSIDEAGLYNGARCREMRVTDVPWPKEYVLARTVRHVRVDNQAFSIANYKPGPRT